MLGPDRWTAGAEEGPLAVVRVRSAWWRCALILPPPCGLTHTHTHTHTQIHLHTPINTHTHTHTQIHTHTPIHAHTYTHTPIHTHCTVSLSAEKGALENKMYYYYYYIHRYTHVRTYIHTSGVTIHSAHGTICITIF